MEEKLNLDTLKLEHPELKTLEENIKKLSSEKISKELDKAVLLYIKKIIEIAELYDLEDYGELIEDIYLLQYDFIEEDGFAILSLKVRQVFLMATIIIVGIMLSLVRISNKGVTREEPEAFFDLADEIGFETKRFLDYGVINLPTTGTVGDIAGQLLNNYSELISNEDVA